MTYRCPVCAYAALPYPPSDYHICPCCSTEFGNDDARFGYAQLREAWVAGGARWFFGRPPERWNPWVQLIHGGYWEAVPLVQVRSRTSVPSERSLQPIFGPRLQGFFPLQAHT